MNEFPFPPAFASRMQRTLGDAFASFEQAHHLPPPVSIRVNPAKPVLQRAKAQKIPWTNYGLYLQERPVFTLDPALHAGAYYVQEASSMFLEQALLQTGSLDGAVRVLDLCAAPGGKSTHIASLLNDKSLLVSNEVIRSRAGILAENLQKWGAPNVVVSNNDPENFSELTGFFDVIVIDAPCSGEGLFRKDPEAMNEWSEENVQLCSKRQRRILSDIWPALKENGILVYATCTYNGLENEENLQWLISEHEAESIPLAIDPSWGIEPVREGAFTGYRCFPHRVKGEGFFLAVLRKKEEQDVVRTKIPKSTFTAPPKKILEHLQAWVELPEEASFIQRQEVVQLLPSGRKEDVEFLSRHLRLVSAGTFVATVKHDKLIPEHALALSRILRKENFFQLEVTGEQALKYLRKETLNVPAAHKGFALILYDNLALGWANVLPNRINNLYPQEWRIRMNG